MTNRGSQWKYFSGKVFQHIEEYTVPQYGDAPDDMASSFSVRDLNLQLQKYILRQINGAKRGDAENMRDYLKIAHYACMAYAKLVQDGDDSE